MEINLIIFIAYISRINGESVYQNVFKQINEIDFRLNHNFNINFNLALKAQFPKVLEIDEIVLLSRIIDIANVPDLSLLESEVMLMGENPIVWKILLDGKHLQFIKRSTFLSALSFLGSTLFERLGSSHSLLRPSCTPSGRYVSSFLKSWNLQNSEWNDPKMVFPISPRIRDLSITRIKCVEDSLVSILSLLRSFTQVKGTELDMSHSVEMMMKSISMIKLLGGKWPIIDLLISIDKVAMDELILAPSIAVVRQTHASSKWVATAPPIWGFPKEGDANPSLVETLIQNLRDGRKLNRTERLFFQSINANWFEIFESKWGLLLTDALSVRRNVSDCLESVCRPTPSACPSVSSSVPVSLRVETGIDILMNAPPDCTVALAAAYVFIHHGFLGTKSTILKSDLSTLLELAWQTIAGEDIESVINNEIPLFEIMHQMWLELTHF